MEKKKGLSLQTILTIAGLALVYLLAFLLPFLNALITLLLVLCCVGEHFPAFELFNEFIFICYEVTK